MDRCRHLLAALALATAATASAQPSATEGKEGKVTLTWLGQSAFRIVSPGGKVIVTDPWLRPNPLTPP